MKLETGKASIPMQSNRPILFVEIQTSAETVFQLKVVDMEAMLLAHEARPDAKGIPNLAAFNPKDNRLWVHPRPDADYPLYLTFQQEAA